MTTADSGSLLTLLHLCDSLFPLGSFVHSDGLETAASSGAVLTGSDLRQWLEATRDEVLARCDGPGLRIGFEACRAGAFTDLLNIDDELDSMRPASASRQAGRAMGTRLLKTWQVIRPSPELEAVMAFRCRESRSAGFTLPVAFGVVCAVRLVPVRAALDGYFYARLAAAVSAAMRVMSIGQHEAHSLLAEALDGVPAAVSRAMDCPQPSSFVPALDLAVMNHQYVHSRLFRS
jgi:urease accessory protein